MKLIIHTKYGKFEGREQPFDQKKYDEIGQFLTDVHRLQYACFETENGEIVMTKPMIDGDRYACGWYDCIENLKLRLK